MENNSSKNYKWIFLIIVAFFVGAVGMYVAFRYLPIKENITKTQKEVTVNENGIADAVEKIYDSVVTVETYNNKKKISSGTGFVYKVEKGKARILTNNHVIENGDEIHLLFTDGTNTTATIIGKDQYADIAVLEVDEDKIIAVAEIGSSSNMRIGDTVFTVGAPLENEYSWTVTRGIVSGKDRMVEVSVSNSGASDWIMKVLQTDAAINSGNSGGPLANSNGEVIGITSLKLVSSGVEGMGFAIPIEDAVDIAEKIESGQESARPYLGLSMINLSDFYSLYQNNIIVDQSIKNGVVIASAEDPSAKAGIVKGDVIIELEGNKVDSIAELRYNLYKYQAGDTITIKIIRGTSEKEVKVKLEASK